MARVVSGIAMRDAEVNSHPAVKEARKGEARTRQ